MPPLLAELLPETRDDGGMDEPAAAEALVNQGGKTAEISALATLVLEYFKQ